MKLETKSHYGFKRKFKRIGLKTTFTTKVTQSLKSELHDSIQEGGLIILSGMLGIGKTTVIKSIKEDFISEGVIKVCNCRSVEKKKFSVTTICARIFKSLSIEEPIKIPSNTEDREELLCQLIEDERKPVAVFIDEAHDLNMQMLKDLKKIIETVEEAGSGVLSIILVGHPKLKNLAQRPYMEEVGARASIIEMKTMENLEKEKFIQWLIQSCHQDEKVEVSTLISSDAIQMLSKRVSTPLQIENILGMAFDQAFEISGEKVETSILESVISNEINDLRSNVVRQGHCPDSISDMLKIRKIEAKQYINGQMSEKRHEEITRDLSHMGINF